MLALLLITALLGHADLVSGPQPGKKAGPYTFLMATGPNRGTSHCYVCETGDEPAVIVLARSTTGPLGDFLKQLDRVLAKHQANKFHAWVTMVGMKQTEKETEIVAWSRKLGLRQLPVGIFEAAAGPPGYKLHPDAEITILLVKDSKVVKNHAFTSKSFTARESQTILEEIPSLMK